MTQFSHGRNGLILPKGAFLEHANGAPIRAANSSVSVDRYQKCPCGSDRRYDKCCGKRHKPVAPKPDAEDVEDQEPDRSRTVAAMRRYGVSDAAIHAYLQVGVLVTDENREIHEPEILAAFDAAAADYIANVDSAPL